MIKRCAKKTGGRRAIQRRFKYDESLGVSLVKVVKTFELYIELCASSVNGNSSVLNHNCAGCLVGPNRDVFMKGDEYIKVGDIFYYCRQFGDRFVAIPLRGEYEMKARRNMQHV